MRQGRFLPTCSHYKGEEEEFFWGRESHPKKPKGQVVLMTPNAGRAYADILGVMWQGVTPADSGTVVRHIRKTASGGVPLVLAKCED